MHLCLNGNEKTLFAMNVSSADVIACSKLQIACSKLQILPKCEELHFFSLYCASHPPTYQWGVSNYFLTSKLDSRRVRWTKKSLTDKTGLDFEILTLEPRVVLK